MKVNELILRNFAQHESLDIDIDSSSLFGIQGANGTGKSSILTGLRYGITGQLEGKASSYIKDFDEEGEAYVKTSFFKGQDVTIERWIGKSNKRKLTVGDEVITSSAGVDAKLTEILGYDPQSIGSMVFVSQGDLASLLIGTSSERERFMTKVVDVGYLRTVSTTIQTRIKQLEAEYRDVESLIEYIENDIKVTNESIISVKTQTILNGITGLNVPSLEKYIVLVNQLETLDGQIRKSKQELIDLEGTLGQYPETHQDRLGELNTLKQGLQSTLKSWSLYKANMEQRSLLQKNRKASFKDYNELLHKWIHLGETDDKINTTYLQSLQNYVRAYDSYHSAVLDLKLENDNLATHNGRPELFAAKIASWEEGIQSVQKELMILQLKEQSEKIHTGHDDKSCMLCGSHLTKPVFTKEDKVALEQFKTSLVSLKESKQQDEKVLSSINNEIGIITNNLVYSNKRVNSSKVLLDESTIEGKDLDNISSTILILTPLLACKTQLEDLEAKLNLFSVEDMEEVDVDTLQTKLTTYDTEITTLTSSIATRNIILGRIISLKSNLSTLENKLGTTNQDYLDLLDEIPNQVGTPLDELRIQIDTWKKLANEEQLLKVKLAQLQKSLKEAKLKEEYNKKHKKVINDLDRLKTLFRDLPAMYVQEKFKELADQTKVNLQLMQANYEIEVDPNASVSFMFRKFGKSLMWLPQDKLSGGEKVRLAISFLIAIQQILLPNLGFLVLDEPSQHLDEQGTDSLRELFTNFHEIVGSRMQLIFCDHKPALTAACEKVFTL